MHLNFSKKTVVPVLSLLDLDEKNLRRKGNEKNFLAVSLNWDFEDFNVYLGRHLALLKNKNAPLLSISE